MASISHKRKEEQTTRQSGGSAEGVIFDIKRYAIHDGPGIRTTVFFKGCPLKCLWCHNPESWSASPEHGLQANRCIGCGRCIEVCESGAVSQVDGRPVTDVAKCTFCGKCVEECAAGAREFIGRHVSVDDVMAEIERDVVFYDESSGGVTFSGGEPLMQPEFLCELLSRCKSHDMRTTVDTSCYAERDVLERVREKTDLFLCDIKHMDSETHRRFTGAPNELILDNIRWLASAGANMILRIPLVPGFNDAETNIDACGRFAASLGCIGRVDVLPYNSGGIEKAARLPEHRELMKSEPPTDDKLNAVRNVLQQFGLEVKIRG